MTVDLRLDGSGLPLGHAGVVVLNLGGDPLDAARTSSRIAGGSGTGA